MKKSEQDRGATEWEGPGGLIPLPAGAGNAEYMAEALLFASAEPLSEGELAEALPAGCDITAAIEALRERYRGRGVELKKIGNAWAFRTAPAYSGLFERQVRRPRKLSRAAIETLAIIAYHQPVTRSEVEEIRGVAASRGTIHTLMELGWVGLGRRRKSPGRPATYVVTREFLDHFGLESTRDLPGLKELRALGLLQQAWYRPSAEGGEAEGPAAPGTGNVDVAVTADREDAPPRASPD